MGIRSLSSENIDGSVVISNNEFYKAESTSGTDYKIAGLTSGNMIQIGAIDYTSAGTIFAGGDNISITTGGASGSTRIKINSSGNVGIGTSSPNHKLDIYSNENIPLRIHRPSNSNLDSAGAHGIGFSTRGDAITSTTDTRSGIFSYYNGNLFFATNTSSIEADPDGSARMTILNTGFVGIGTTSPSTPLHIESTSTPQLRVAYNGSNYQSLTYEGSDIVGGSQVFKIAGSEKMRLDTSGNLGIGLTSPIQKLDTPNIVIGGSTIAGTYRANALFMDNNGGNSRFYSSGADASTKGSYEFNIMASDANPLETPLVIANTGYVGIGTTSPSSTLSVQGTTNNGINVIGVGTTANRCYVGLNASNHGQLFVTGSSGQSPSLISSAGDNSYISGGNVGIGTTSPASKLDVRGILNVRVDGGNEQFVIKRESNTNEQLILGFHSSDYGTIQAVEQGVAYRALALNPSGGNVGIGTTSPAVKLDVRGEIAVAYNATYGLRFYNDARNNWSSIGNTITGSSSANLVFKDATGEVMRIATGKVGIGTTSPNNKLEISDTGVGTGSTHLKISRGADATAVQRIAGIKMGNTASNDGSNWIVQADSSLGYFDSADLDFIHNVAGTATTRMRIKSGGNVGIGTTTPQSKLDVRGVITAGDSTTDNTIRRKHQSFATMKPGPTSGGSVDMMFVDHTHALDITVMAYVNTSNVATGRGYSVAAYGSTSTGLTQTAFAGVISALSISYVNTGGTENYVLRVTTTYSGATAPVLSVTATGQSSSKLRAAT